MQRSPGGGRFSGTSGMPIFPGKEVGHMAEVPMQFHLPALQSITTETVKHLGDVFTIHLTAAAP